VSAEIPVLRYGMKSWGECQSACDEAWLARRGCSAQLPGALA
jgi:hypothetical protein